VKRTGKGKDMVGKGDSGLIIKKKLAVLPAEGKSENLSANMLQPEKGERAESSALGTGPGGRTLQRGGPGNRLGKAELTTGALREKKTWGGGHSKAIV